MRSIHFSSRQTWGLALLLMVAGCFVSCRRQCTYVCDEPYFGVTYKGFTEADIDTVIVKRYASSGRFDELISETTMYDIFYHGLGRYDPASDWEFYIPATQETYRFSEIIREGRTTMKGECKTTRGCSNYIFSYKINGKVMNQSYGELVR